MTSRVSFIMAARNAEHYIEAAVQSALSQTYRDLEVIVVDDCSTDGTRAVVEGLPDDRVQVVAGCGRGAASARNAGIDAASGEFIAVLDADDIALPDRVERQVQYLDAHPNTVVVGSWMYLADVALAPLGVLSAPTHEDEVTESLLRGLMPLLNPTVLMRAECVKAVGGYDIRLDCTGCEDHEFLCRLARTGRGANIGLPLVVYRLCPGALTSGLGLLPTKLQRRRAVALQRVSVGCERTGDVEDIQRLSAAAREVAPQLAYNYRVGKTILQAHGDARTAARYLARAWSLRPQSVRVAKNLAVAVIQSVAKHRHGDSQDAAS